MDVLRQTLLGACLGILRLPHTTHAANCGLLLNWCTSGKQYDQLFQMNLNEHTYTGPWIAIDVLQLGTGVACLRITITSVRFPHVHHVKPDATFWTLAELV